MGNVFAMDGPVMNFLNKICDLVVLNILWLVCCLPIFTIGASTTALYAVALKLVRNEESNVSKMFFQAFCSNFKQSTIVWLLTIGAVWVFYMDFYYCLQLDGGMKNLFMAVLGLAGILLLITLCYVFPIQAYFFNSTKKLLKNSFLMAVSHLPYTFAILFTNLLPWLLLFLGEIVVATFICAMIGFSFCAWINARIFRKIFDKFEVEAE